MGRAISEIKTTVGHFDSKPSAVFELKVEKFAPITVVVVVQHGVGAVSIVCLDIKKPSRLRVSEIAPSVTARAVIFIPIAPIGVSVIRAPMSGSLAPRTGCRATTTSTSQVVGTIWFPVTWICNPVEN